MWVAGCCSGEQFHLGRSEGHQIVSLVGLPVIQRRRNPGTIVLPRKEFVNTLHPRIIFPPSPITVPELILLQDLEIQLATSPDRIKDAPTQTASV